MFEFYLINPHKFYCEGFRSFERLIKKTKNNKIEMGKWLHFPIF